MGIRSLFISVDAALQFAVSGCEFKLIAKDGIFLHEAPRDVAYGFMAPGNRADMLVKCPPGRHTITVGDISAVTDGGTSRTNLLPSQSVLATIVAEDDGASFMRPQHMLNNKCAPSSFSVNRPCYLVDLRNEPVMKKNTFEMMTLGPNNATRTDTFYLVKDDRWVDYNTYLHTFEVGELGQIEVWGSVDFHPLHIH